MSSPPMFNDILYKDLLFALRDIITEDYLVSPIMMPSSTHAMFVVVAPRFTTHAFDIPAPYVAANDSWS